MKAILNFLLLSSLVTLYSCQKEEEHPAPSACFQVDRTESTDPTHYFVFTNCSKNFQSVTWNFGDGYSSTDFNPTHRFNQIGQYTVTLTINNSDGVTGTNTRSITIGHYTLTKIVYNHLNSAVNYPKHVYWSYYNSITQVYNNDANITGLSQVPFTVTLNDNVLYDNHSNWAYLFSENDFAGHTYNSSYFNISDLEIINNKVDKTFYYQTDSAKVSLYFKIVPR